MSTLTRDGHKREAKSWLGCARTTGVAPACIEHMRFHLKEGKCTLSEIGTSEDDLKIVIDNYHKRAGHDN